MTAPTSDIYPVHAVTRYLRELLDRDRHLADLWVAGEVSGLTRAASGHIYFTLKDDRSALRCVFFRNRSAGQRDRVESGVSLVVHGSLSLYEPRGEISFIVDFVQPEGTGALAAEFERRRAQFEAEGLFAPERKQPLPRFPQRIGVVTSPTGAVFHDISNVLARRWPLATLLLQPTAVQGPEAPTMIADALHALAREQRPDVIILARGGGAAEELWTFNEEPVVRAIFGCEVPVVSAIGHETDTTLADLVADVRAPTPSVAAELVAPDRVEVAREVAVLRARAEVHTARALVEARERVDRHVSALHHALPDLAAERRRVDGRASELLHAARAVAVRTTGRTVALAGRLGALSPLATLQRGYAVIERPDGSVVGSAAALRPGERVDLRMRDGRRPARIEAEQSP